MDLSVPCTGRGKLTDYTLSAHTPNTRTTTTRSSAAAAGGTRHIEAHACQEINTSVGTNQQSELATAGCGQPIRAQKNATHTHTHSARTTGKQRAAQSLLTTTHTHLGYNLSYTKPVLMCIHG